MHRVRILRTRLSEPQCHHDTASTDRSAAGDDAPKGRLRDACTTPTGVSVRRDRDLRGRRHVLHSLSDRNQHRGANQRVQSAREQPCRRVGGAAARAALESGRTLGALEPMGSACVFLRVWSEAADGSYRCRDRKSTRLNSSHSQNSYAVFCLKKKKNQIKVHENVKKKILKKRIK